MPDTTAQATQPTSATLPPQWTEPARHTRPSRPAPRPGRGWLARRARAVLAHRVGRELDRLVRHDPRWRCRPAVTLGDGTVVDHLVVGPAGVFALVCDSGATPAERLGDQLSETAGVALEARVVVVIGSGGALGDARDPASVHEPASARVTVVHRDRLRSFLSTRPECLAPVTVERLYAAAGDAGTSRSPVR